MANKIRKFKEVETLQKADVLKKVPSFSSLDTKQLRYLSDAAEYKLFPKDSYVFKQGEPSRGILFIIVSGRARIVVLTEEEQVAKTEYREPYDFVGITALIPGEMYPHSVVADEDLTCLLIPNDVLSELMKEDAEFASSFSMEVRRRLRRLYKSLSREKIETLLMEEELKKNLPLRKKVADIMTSPVVTCDCMDYVDELARIMSRSGVSSVVVVSPTGEPLGIVTENDLVKKVVAVSEASPRELRAHQVMSSQLITVSAEEFSYQALLLMAKHTIKHVVVTDNGKLAGIVTLRDLVRFMQAGTLSIVKKIESEQEIEGLGRYVREIDHVLQVLVTERALASEIVLIISEFYDRLTRKIIYLSEREMVDEGYGEPPVDYSWINMGSSGRLEQFSRTDQDNGIIFEDPGDNDREELRKYFLTLGGKVVSGLEKCDFRRCEGLVMADNPYWCRSTVEWDNTVREWIDVLEPKNVRNITIFLDFRHIYGSPGLAENLREHTSGLFKDFLTAPRFLVNDVLLNKVPLSIFRNIITEKTGPYRKHINLKSSACVHIVDCIRAYSLREGIKETPTFVRIAELQKCGVLSEENCEAVRSAYEMLMLFRIRRAAERLAEGKEPDNFINPHKLNKQERAVLREALLTVNMLQDLAAQHFRIYG